MEKKKKPPPSDAYAQARPKQFGTLHQRMKWAVELADKIAADNDWEDACEKVQWLDELQCAVYDLATEVKFYHSAKSSFAAGSRRRRRAD